MFLIEIFLSTDIEVLDINYKVGMKDKRNQRRYRYACKSDYEINKI